MKGLKQLSDFLVFWQKQSSIRLTLILENSKADYVKVFLTYHAYYLGDYLWDWKWINDFLLFWQK